MSKIIQAIFSSDGGATLHGRVRRATKGAVYLHANAVPRANDTGRLHIRLPAARHGAPDEFIDAECRVGALLVSNDRLQAELRIVKWGTDPARLIERLTPPKT